jgi:hypothetical protein
MDSRPLTLKQFRNRKIESWAEHVARFSYGHEDRDCTNGKLAEGVPCLER